METDIATGGCAFCHDTGHPKGFYAGARYGPLFFDMLFFFYPHYGIVSAKGANCARPMSTELSHSQPRTCGMEGIWPVKARAPWWPDRRRPTEWLFMDIYTINCSAKGTIKPFNWENTVSHRWASTMSTLNSSLIILTNPANNRIVHAFWLAKSIGDAGSTFVGSESRFSRSGTCHNLFVHAWVQLS